MQRKTRIVVLFIFRRLVGTYVDIRYCGVLHHKLMKLNGSVWFLNYYQLFIYLRINLISILTVSSSQFYRECRLAPIFPQKVCRGNSVVEANQQSQNTHVRQRIGMAFGNRAERMSQANFDNLSWQIFVLVLTERSYLWVLGKVFNLIPWPCERWLWVRFQLQSWACYSWSKSANL